MKVGYTALAIAGALGVRFLLVSGLLCLSGCAGVRFYAGYDMTDSITETRKLDKEPGLCKIWPFVDCPFGAAKEEKKQ